MVSNDLKWDLNTAQIVKKANARMALLRKVPSFRPPVEDLKDIYILFIRNILEQSAVVWQSSLTNEKKMDLERVQKSAIRITSLDATVFSLTNLYLKILDFSEIFFYNMELVKQFTVVVGGGGGGC